MFSRVMFSVRGLVSVYLIVLGQSAYAQMVFCPPVPYCPPVYIEPAPIVHYGPPPIIFGGPVYASPVIRHICPPLPERCTVTNTSVDGVGTITTMKEHHRRIPGRMVVDHRQDMNGFMRTTSYWEVVDIFTFQQSVDIPQIGERKILNWYEETLTYVDGVSRRCYRRGWGMSDSGRQDWEREFVRLSNGEWMKVRDVPLPTPHIEINPPRLEPIPAPEHQPTLTPPQPTFIPSQQPMPALKLPDRLVSTGGWRASFD